MLSQERYKLILEKLEKESVVYLNDLVEYLNIFLFSSLSVSIPASTISLYDISL